EAEEREFFSAGSPGLYLSVCPGLFPGGAVAPGTDGLYPTRSGIVATPVEAAVGDVDTPSGPVPCSTKPSHPVSATAPGRAFARTGRLPRRNGAPRVPPVLASR